MKVLRGIQGFSGRLLHPQTRVEVPVRISLLGLLALLVIGVLGWAGYRTLGSSQPNPAYAVAPGTVPMASPTWLSRRGKNRIVLPSQAVGVFPYGTPRPATGSVEFVQVLKFLPKATQSENDDRLRLGLEPRALRAKVEVRAVRTRPFEPGYQWVEGVDPEDIIVPHYLYSLGEDAIVSAQSPPMRRVEFPARPPRFPVVVEYARGSGAFRVSVSAPKPGWKGTVYPLGTGRTIELRAEGRRGRLLTARVPDDLLGDQSEIFAYDIRPQLNIAWLNVTDEQGNQQVSAPLRF